MLRRTSLSSRKLSLDRCDFLSICRIHNGNVHTLFRSVSHLRLWVKMWQHPGIWKLDQCMSTLWVSRINSLNLTSYVLGNFINMSWWSRLWFLWHADKFLVLDRSWLGKKTAVNKKGDYCTKLRFLGDECTSLLAFCCFAAHLNSFCVHYHMLTLVDELSL